MTNVLPSFREEFDRLVHEALNHLYDSPFLEKLPLLDWLAPTDQVSGSRSQHLRRLLINTIQSFKPDRSAPLQSPDWRGYQILEQRFISGLSPNEVIVRMNISRSLFFMEQARMVKHLTDLLWDQATATHKAKDSPTNPSGVASEKTAPEPHPQSTEALLAKSAFKPVSIASLLESLLPVARSLMCTHQVDLICAPTPKDHIIPLADRVLLRQVIISLIAELVTLVPGGKVTLQTFEHQAPTRAALYGIRIQAQASRAKTNLTVVEDRQGLSPEVCRNLIRAMRGDLTVQMTSPTEYSAELIWQFEKIAPRHILLIDDQPDLGDLFRRYLEGSTWQIRQATSTEAARAELAAKRPELILLDVIMPHEDGWEFLVEIQDSADFRGIPIVVCSAVNEPELVRSLGAAGYLPKPVSQSDLLKMLKKID
jgi:CheY-like chemotaxis protein